MSEETTPQQSEDTPAQTNSRYDTVSARNYFRSQIAQNPKNLTAYLSLAKLLPVLMERERILARAQRIAPEDAVIAEALQATQALMLQGVTIVPVTRIPETINLELEAAAEVIAQSGISTELAIIPELVPEPVTVYCPIHPEAIALLRCISCEQPMCARCATMTAVGQICDSCKLARIPDRYKSRLGHQVLTFFFTLSLSGIAIVLASLILPFPFIGPFLFLAGGILTGNLIVTTVTRLIKKRGRALVIAAGIGVGVACGLVFGFRLLSGRVDLFFLLLLVMFAVLAIRNIREQLR
jgi:hypothetical protein